MGNMTQTPEVFMQRTLNPVGQGAFYTEQFLNYKDKGSKESVLYTVVYDCGSKNNKALTTAINKMFPKEKAEVDVLFLSHFHDDHVNGVVYLRSRVQQINCVVMPLLQPSQIVMAFLSCNIDLFNIYTFKKTYKINKIVFIDRVGTSSPDVEPSSRNQRPNINNTNSQAGGVRNIEDLHDLEIISSGTSLGLKRLPKRNHTHEWTYIPFNMCDESEYDNFKKFLEGEDSHLAERLKKLIGGCNLGNMYGIKFTGLLSDWNEIKTRVKKFYKRYINKSKNYSDFNDSSMIVYSGPIKNNTDLRRRVWTIESINTQGSLIKFTNKQEKRDKLVAALYIGDMNLNKNVGSLKVYEYIHEELKDYVVNLGLIQIPHHGSKHNFNNGLTATFPKTHCYFYSFGLRNSYGHPFPGVRIWLQYDGKMVFEITEDKETKLIQNIAK